MNKKNIKYIFNIILIICASIFLGHFTTFTAREVILLTLCVIFIKVITTLQNQKFNILIAEQRNTYISTLNHDLKIPILAQIRALQLLSEEKIGTINDNQKEIVSLTLNSCSYMYDMLSSILTTYRYENNDISLYRENIQLLKLLDDCLLTSSNNLKNKNIKIRINAQENCYFIHADKNQIKKALKNIINDCISNACENTQINLDINRKDKNIFLSLCYENPYLNINPDHHPSSEQLTKVGSSLELHLAKTIINAHNGTLEIENNNSNCNIYNIQLPSVNDCKLSATYCLK